MPQTRILVAVSPGEERVATVRDGVLLDYAIGRPGLPDGVGDLHRGRVIAHAPALAGAFVAIAGAEGFLPDSEGGAGTGDGVILGVRVTRAAQGGKGPRLSARLAEDEAALVGAGPPALLRRGPGVVERLARLYPDAPVLADDPATVAALRPVLGERIGVAGGPAWDDALAERIEALASPYADLPGGMRASFHPTPALVAIDLDSGGASAARQGKQAAQMAANRAALPALAREIRLRNFSGAILVDLAGMSSKRRRELGPTLAAALAEDPLRPRLLGFTALGLAEIVRSRVHPPLHELLATPHAAALAALRHVATESAARPAWAPALRAAPAIVAALRADAAAMQALAHRAGRPLILHSDPALSPQGWRVEE